MESILGGYGYVGVSGFVVGFFNHPRDRWGEAAMQTMRASDSVEVIRLVRANDLKEGFRDQPFYGMVQTGEAIKAPDAWVSRMRDAVDNSRNYEWLWQSRCLPVPGVCVRYHRGDDCVDLLICFECDLMSLASTGGHGGSISKQWIDFRAKRSPFADLVKELYPNDAAIQGITSR